MIRTKPQGHYQLKQVLLRNHTIILINKKSSSKWLSTEKIFFFSYICKAAKTHRQPTLSIEQLKEATEGENLIQKKQQQQLSPDNPHIKVVKMLRETRTIKYTLSS